MKFSRIFLAVAVCTGMLFAATTATAPATTPDTTVKAKAKTVKVKAPKIEKISGKVVSVDAIGNTLIVKVSKKVTDTVTVTTDTKILSGKTVVALADLKADQKVKVTLKADKKTATEINIVPVKVAKAKEAKPAK